MDVTIVEHSVSTIHSYITLICELIDY